ncbi:MULTISPECIES: hypothetical protein [Stappiaceae]|jgi:uncharacterized protein with PhoU and TrkA domain|uniref:hypothetical protein n=1 Tax=Stappiaceae TaxID=2821832 RepID=UPI00092A7C3B|nr:MULTISPECIES: hypothetical protein [unclassified Labrenzia]MBO9418852.1 hypothetical protein [Labrenzia sp. R4_2]MBO9427086.1 hypothetical protein [Labrenzia sp. R4_1]OJJ12230.1 hypothetical protein BKI51_11420 [Alphaproteobacteria bacterium AO1-B]
MPDIKDIVDELKQTRDEVKLKIHLGSKELQEEWDELEKKWDSFEAEAKLGESAQNISEATSLLGDELSKAFKKIRSAL